LIVPYLKKPKKSKSEEKKQTYSYLPHIYFDAGLEEIYTNHMIDDIFGALRRR